MNPRNLQGMAVVALAEAERVGRVVDVMFETSPLRAVGLRVSTDNGERLVNLDRVQAIGSDAITTESLDVAAGVEARADRRQLLGLDDLGDLKVVDDHGSFVGRIVAVDMDEKTGAVPTIEVRRGQVLGMGGETSTIATDDILSVGPELITVRSTA